MRHGPFRIAATRRISLRKNKKRANVLRMRKIMSVFTTHHDELEHYEQMYGKERGRLAVGLDLLTNALVLVGQHAVYCTSQRDPTLPAMDIRLITQELVHAKELVQSVMQEIRKSGQTSEQ
jgi:hypothetical protein